MLSFPFGGRGGGEAGLIPSPRGERGLRAAAVAGPALPTCEVAQALQAGGEVALGALGVPEVQGLQGRQSWELPAGRGGGQARGRCKGTGLRA